MPDLLDTQVTEVAEAVTEELEVAPEVEEVVGEQLEFEVLESEAQAVNFDIPVATLVQAVIEDPDAMQMLVIALANHPGFIETLVQAQPQPTAQSMEVRSQPVTIRLVSNGRVVDGNTPRHVAPQAGPKAPGRPRLVQQARTDPRLSAPDLPQEASRSPLARMVRPV